MFSQGGIGNIAKTNKKPIPTRPGNLTSALLILAIRVFQRRWGAWIQNCLILMISNSIFLNYLDQPQGIVERLAHRFAKIRCKLLSSKARATLAQLVERLIRNQQVSGSIPEGGSKNQSPTDQFKRHHASHPTERRRRMGTLPGLAKFLRKTSMSSLRTPSSRPCGLS
jgi:hypothetical protein